MAGRLVPTAQARAPEKQTKTTWIVLIVLAACCACSCPILAAILFPVFAQARKAAQATVLLSQAKQVDLSVLMYANDYDDKLPPLDQPHQLATLLGPYLKTPVLQQKVTTYDWNQELSGASLNAVANPSTACVLSSMEPDPGDRFDVGYASGACARVTKEHLDAIKSVPALAPPDEPEKAQKTGP